MEAPGPVARPVQPRSVRRYTPEEMVTRRRFFLNHVKPLYQEVELLHRSNILADGKGTSTSVDRQIRQRLAIELARAQLADEPFVPIGATTFFVAVLRYFGAAEVEAHEAANRMVQAATQVTSIADLAAVTEAPLSEAQQVALEQRFTIVMREFAKCRTALL